MSESLSSFFSAFVRLKIGSWKSRPCLNKVSDSPLSAFFKTTIFSVLVKSHNCFSWCSKINFSHQNTRLFTIQLILLDFSTFKPTLSVK